MSKSLDWHWADVKAALAKAGWTLGKLAEHHGLHPRSPSHVANVRWPAMQQHIAAAIGRRPQDIWPSRYDSDGFPLRGTPGRKSSTGRRARHVQRREAA